MGKLKSFLSKIFIFCIFIITFSDCKKEQFDTSSESKLNFSEEVILFDTVFSTIGSATHYLKVYNNHKKSIRISSINLAGGAGSSYRLNVNGKPGISFSNIEILPNDSIFIFVEVTVNPTNINSPLVVKDSLIFETNGNLQDVDLIAWGQDAYYHYPNHFNKDTYNYSIVSTSTWTNDKPHLIFDYLKIDTNATLTLEAGCRLHFHNKSGICISQGASLIVNGTMEEPVKFLGDRLEPYYADIPGQWDGIWFESNSSQSLINYAEIKNATNALVFDYSNYNASPIATISNTIIKNISKNAIYMNSTSAEFNNCMIYNCGSSAITINEGGSYDFKHCTIGNYWNYSIRRSSSVYISNRKYEGDGSISSSNLDKCNFSNCIIWGALNDKEIYLDKYGESNFNANFENSLIKIDLSNININYFYNCKINTNPDFNDYVRNDYSLKSTSPAINNANLYIANQIPIDLKGKSRILDGLPDIGAIEYQP